MIFLKFFTCALIGLLLAGCEGALLDPTVLENTKLKTDPFSEMKLIAPEIRDSKNENALMAKSYQIHEKSRLIFRNPQLQDIEAQMLNLYPILIRLQLQESISEQALSEIQICPLTKNWMMFATWEKAHPYKGGRWEVPGGDYDPKFCISSMQLSALRNLNSDEKSFCEEGRAICFDVRPLLAAAVSNTTKNYGFILINQSRQPVYLYGDASFSQPLLAWRGLRR